MDCLPILASGYFAVSLCYLHKPCKFERKCGDGGVKEVYNFDEIKEDYCKGGMLYASVDAITSHNATFYFVEMKGWKEYLDRTTEITEKGIQAQADKYNLAKKLSDSIFICGSMLRQCSEEVEKEFVNMRKCYVIVTDITPQKNPLASFVSNLNMLAETSSLWEVACWDRLKEKVGQVKDMKTIFVTCHEFDSLFT